MQPLSASEILRLWEWGSAGVRPIDRDLALLSLACPGVSREVLSHLPLGARDKQILRLREMSFGRVLAAYTECPQCNEGVEFSFSGEDIMPDAMDGVPDLDVLLGSTNKNCVNEAQLNEKLSLIVRLYELDKDNCQIKFRLPNSTDLLALKNDLDTSTATDFILQRCVSQVVVKGEQTSLDHLPLSVQEEVIEQMAEYDSHADILLSMTCPACAHKWHSVFDIGEYLWREISTQTRRLIQEVATLAQGYGWSESEILSMSETRRRLYLEVL